MTFGSFPVEEHQEKFQADVLSRFDRESVDVKIPDERRYDNPVVVEDSYSFDDDEDVADKSHVVIGWLLGRSDDFSEMLKAHLLSGVLLDNSASPLRKFLETTELAAAPSELCGLDDSTREATFQCGLEGTDPRHAEAIEEQILDVLRAVAREGVPREQVESVLHQVELAQREVGGGRFPYGLQLMLRVMPTYLHGGDPVAALDIDDALAGLRRSIEDPDYIKDLTQKLLLDNPHRVRLTMAPDRSMSSRQSEALAKRLQERERRLDDEEKARIVEQAAALKLRQEQEEDAELLPRVGLEDVPDDRAIPEGTPGQVGGMPVTWYSQGTNGLVYQQLVVELPALAPDLVDVLGLFCDCLTEVGCGDRDYLRMQARQAAVTGGMSARVSCRSLVDDVTGVRGLFVLSGKALVRNEGALASLLEETLGGARFDELGRLRELIAQFHAHADASITQSGHTLAMSAACAGLAPAAMLEHRWDGLEGVRRLKALDEALRDESRLADFAASLERIRELVAAAPRQALLVGEPTRKDALHASLAELWADAPAGNGSPEPFAWEWSKSRVRQAWGVNTQVNFCAKAYATVHESHADAPALMVLGPYLTNGFLHRSIREQGGAYGGGAGYSPNSGAMRFYSYRDPRLAETLVDFDRAAAWLVEGRHDHPAGAERHRSSGIPRRRGHRRVLRHPSRPHPVPSARGAPRGHGRRHGGSRTRGGTLSGSGHRQHRRGQQRDHDRSQQGFGIGTL
jgi:Zn-dependent M16 (insulinase) family peptidase